MAESGTSSHQPDQAPETEATNPFSDGFFERRLKALERRESEEPSSSRRSPSVQQPLNRLNHGESSSARDPVASQMIPIQQLDTDSLTCRFLFLPRVVESFIAKGGEWITLRDSSHTVVRCMAFTQTAEDIACEVKSPIQCKLYFDATQDAVLLMNSAKPIDVEELADQPGDTGGRKTIIESFEKRALAPGFWRLQTGQAGLLDVRIYRRQHSLVLVRRDAPIPAAGSKRLASSDPEDTTIQSPPAMARAEIIRPLDSPAALSDGETALVTTNTGSYSIFRMRKLSDTRAARVFEARHSAYPNEVIVVKTLRFDSHHDASDHGMIWQREYDIHRQLQSDNIVELFSGDVRLRSLYLQRVDASDLAHRDWCNRAGDFHFRGTQQDAARVLVDMATALEYLREKRILHNDIKPSNILYSRRSGAVLIDFGLGTVDGSVISNGGTPWYVAPELMTVTERGPPADVWALGVVMIYLLKRIPLPDSQRQVALWMIRDVIMGQQRVEQSPAEESMTRWQAIVDDVAEGLRGEEKLKIVRITIRMLESDPTKRLTAAGLAKAARDVRINESLAAG